MVKVNHFEIKVKQEVPTQNGDDCREEKRDMVEKFDNLDLDTDIKVIVKVKRTRPKSASMATPEVKKRQLYA